MPRGHAPLIASALCVAAGCTGPSAGLTHYTGTILSIEEPAGPAVFPQTGHAEPYTLIYVALNRVSDASGEGSQPSTPIRIQIVAIGVHSLRDFGSRGDPVAFDSPTPLVDAGSCELNTLRNVIITRQTPLK